MTSRIDQAADLVEAKSHTVRKAARQLDISEAGVYAELARRRAAAGDRCPCCGQVRNAVTIERKALLATLQETRDSLEMMPAKRVVVDRIMKYLENLP